MTPLWKFVPAMAPSPDSSTAFTTSAGKFSCAAAGPGRSAGEQPGGEQQAGELLMVVSFESGGRRKRDPRAAPPPAGGAAQLLPRTFSTSA
jgi:hypothetical protein